MVNMIHPRFPDIRRDIHHTRVPEHEKHGWTREEPLPSQAATKPTDKRARAKNNEGESS